MTNNAHVQSQGITFVLSEMAQELQIILCQSVQNGEVERLPELDNNIEEADMRLIPHVIYEVETLPELDNNIEETDMRLIPHVIYAVLAGIEMIVVLSGDTDVLVIALYFWNLLNSHGLRQFWMRAGVNDSTRYIPLHSLAKNIGSLCHVLPAIHALTGSNITSKVGTKAAAPKADPVSYLKGFGEVPTTRT